MEKDGAVQGVAQLHAALIKHGADVDRRISRVMVASAGRVVKDEAKKIAASKLTIRSGALLRNIAIKRERTPEGVTQYNLGVRHGRDLGRKAETKLGVGRSGRIVKQYVNDPFYWRFHELGTKRLPKRDFIAPALENKRDAAIDAMGERLAKELAKANKT